ncbi:Major facilitator superfamily multidrug transporter mdrA [Penicillium oxalicum]|uniref:Major facilitator superfamily multidrug transporter mdrA n=1 Tax=Penicillium oxalicum TaxID=69781 RepID=UPI0020B73176|nr:Major facilitator superfamily multidrug transporter mdrA [Penicillium oxalicum]KAI2789140.1 Major facilitator superfamily multidrug transporter mdrA [Penicillium oxalicum]
MADSIPAEAESPRPSKIPYWSFIFDQKVVTEEVASFPYAGSGTDEDPFVVTWLPRDPRNPMNFSSFKKWAITFLVSFVTLAVALVSSAYSGGIRQIVIEFEVEEEIAILGVSLFVLGFAIGPLIWAPMSEIFGRRHVFTFTYACLTALNAGAAGATNITTLIILRFLAGCFGSSPFGNAGGTIADLFTASQRGMAISFFAAAPFLGPTLGPVIGGFLATAAGWRWVEGLLAAFSGLLWLCIIFLLPETYAPVLLRRRAAKLCELTGKTYRSKIDIERGPTPLGRTLKTALSRPWILLFREPIVFLFSVYMSIIYGTLYMLFAAYPIVFQQGRGWSEGIGGLAFLGILVGMVAAVIYNFPENVRYAKKCSETTDRLPPELRLPPSMVGGVALPIGLFWFAWTNYPSIHWIVPIAAGAPFGFGMVLVFLSVMNYLIDSYTIYAASVLAANSALRSLFGMAFPLFTTYMYHNLGVHWASSIPAFLSLACVPFPFIFWKYGAQVRQRCTYAAEADAFMRRLAEKNQAEIRREDVTTKNDDETPEKERLSCDVSDDTSDTESLSTVPSRISLGRLASRASRLSGRSMHRTPTATQYEENPYDLDIVNTRQSAMSGHRQHV